MFLAVTFAREANQLPADLTDDAASALPFTERAVQIAHHRVARRHACVSGAQRGQRACVRKVVLCPFERSTRQKKRFAAALLRRFCTSTSSSTPCSSTARASEPRSRLRAGPLHHARPLYCDFVHAPI